ncbi:MAG: hypothetical protein QM723_05535 [Myxococcaceae bacterium]
MENIYAGIHDASAADAPRRRANAVELLDNLLDRELKKVFLPLLDEIPRAERLKQVEQFVALPKKAPPELLADLCKDETAWVRACALWCSSEAVSPPPGANELIETAVGDANAIVREISLVSLEKKLPERAHALAEKRLRDEAPFVRQQAALITARKAQLSTV